MDDFVSISALLIPMHYYLLLFARVQKVTPAVLRDKRQDPSNAVLCFANPSLLCSRSWLLPILRTGPSRQLMSYIAIHVLFTDSHRAFDKDSVILIHGRVMARPYKMPFRLQLLAFSLSYGLFSFQDTIISAVSAQISF